MTLEPKFEVVQITHDEFGNEMPSIYNNFKVPKGNNGTLLKSAVQYVNLNTVITDYAKATRNTAVMATLQMPYYNEKGERVTPKIDKALKGFMTSGFGWSIQNNYEDLLSATSAQQTATKFLQGTGEFFSGLGGKVPEQLAPLVGALSGGQGKAVTSIQQTMSVWLSMKKPEFQLSMLFFDGEGTSTTSVTNAAYIIERAQLPKIHTVSENSNLSLLMSAPGGYLPTFRNDNSDGNVNKTYGLSAEGTSRLVIGQFAQFPEIICTGASMQFSDKMLNNGKPQWLNVTFNFTMWRLPTLDDLNNRYL